jgi:hypothetical protein
MKNRRPGWVWVISFFFFLSAGWTLLSIFLVSSGALQLPPAQRAYFDNLTGLDYGLSIILGLVNLSGAISLFFMRKIALDLFIVALLVNLPYSIWNAVKMGFFQTFGAPGSFGLIIGLALQIAVVTYSLRLVKRGILK